MSKSRKQRTVKRKCPEERGGKLCRELGSQDATQFDTRARTIKISDPYRGFSLWYHGVNLA